MLAETISNTAAVSLLRFVTDVVAATGGARIVGRSSVGLIGARAAIYRLLKRLHVLRQTGSSMPQSLIDPTRMLENSGQDANFVRELIGVFLETSGELVQDLTASLSGQNWPEVARAAHTLKSPLGFFGADSAIEVAQAIESQADAGGNTHVAELVDQLLEDVRQVQSELRDTLAGDSAPD